jgi:hypothetical protein
VNKLLLVFVSVLAHFNAFAVEKCDDMSHVRTIDGVPGEFVVTQDGCGGWSSVQIFRGVPVAEPWYVKFSDEPTVVKVDDEYETYEATDNWGWHAPTDGYGQVLGHSHFHEGFNKKTGVKTVILMIETFSRMGEHVHHGGAKTRTEIAPDGTQTTTTTPFDEFFKRK